MGKASMEYKELRFIIEDELTQVFVAIQAHGDSPLGVQGWHHKTFPVSKSVLDIMKAMFEDGDNPVLWSQEAPNS